MLSALCSKLASQSKNFGHSDHDLVEWKNLYALTKICRKFIFQTVWWSTGIGGREAMSLIPEEKKEEPASAGGPQLILGGASNPMQQKAAADRAKLVTMRKPETGAEDCVLYKWRVGKSERTFEEATDLTDHGLHWADDGRASDIGLVQKIIELFKALRINEYTAELNPTMSSKDKEYMTASLKEFEFWEDSKTFLEIVVKDDIEKRNMLSYRKMSFLAEGFLSANHSKSGRKSVLSEMQGLVKDRAKADAKAAKDAEARRALEGEYDDEPGMMPMGETAAAAAPAPAPEAPREASMVHDLSSLPPHLRQRAKEAKTTAAPAAADD